MFHIDKNYAISLTRGDTAALEISFSGDAPTAEDTVIAALKKAPGYAETIWEKTLTREDDGKYLLDIESEDTAALPFRTYAWDLRIIYGDGQVITPFAAVPFRVTEVVTDLPDGDEAP